jgi:hypothetical protein
MAASPARRQKRLAQRESVKMFNKIRQQTIDEINRQSPEEREKLMELYSTMLNQQKLEKQKKDNGM